MSDWGATHSTAAASVAGLDQEMPGGAFFTQDRIREALRNGTITEQNVDTLNKVGVFNETHDHLYYTRLNWSVASPQSIGCVDKSCRGWDYFSAVCWFAIRDLHDMLNGSVPVGGISQNYGE